MEVLQLETSTGLGFCVSLYLLKWMYFSVRQYVFVFLCECVCVWKLQGHFCILSFWDLKYLCLTNNLLKQEEITFWEFLSDQTIMKGVYERSCGPAPELFNHKIKCKLNGLFSLFLTCKLVLILFFKNMVDEMNLPFWNLHFWNF